MDMDAVADMLARFHTEARQWPSRADVGRPAFWMRLWKQQLAEMTPHLDGLLSREAYQALLEGVLKYVIRNQARLDGRREEGRLRNGHGDLRCEHIYLNEPIRIIDTADFDPQQRYGDVAYDLALLLMDLTHRGRPDLARQVMERYVARTGDTGLVPLVPFYACHRAFFRGRVLALRREEAGLPEADREGLAARARGYFRLAVDFCHQMPLPIVVVLTGLPGAGKSFLADVLGEQLGAAVLNYDRTRARQSATAAGMPVAMERPDVPDAVYHAMVERTEELVEIRHSVVLDGMFPTNEHRRLAVDAAREAGAEVFLIECDAAEAVLLDRLRDKARAGQAQALSKAELAAIRRHFEALEPDGGTPSLKVATDQPIQQVVQRIQEHPRFAAPAPLFGLPATLHEA